MSEYPFLAEGIDIFVFSHFKPLSVGLSAFQICNIFRCHIVTPSRRTEQKSVVFSNGTKNAPGKDQRENRLDIGVFDKIRISKKGFEKSLFPGVDAKLMMTMMLMMMG